LEQQLVSGEDQLELAGEPMLPGQEGPRSNGVGRPVLRKGGVGEDGMFQDEAMRGKPGTNGTGRPGLQKGVLPGEVKGDSRTATEMLPLPTRKPNAGDGFAGVPVPGGKAAQPGQGVEAGGPARSLEELLPDFDGPLGLEEIAKRFAADLAKLGGQLRPSQLSPGERALRMWAFYLAYADAAAAADPRSRTREAVETFRKALQEHGFAGLRDARTGRDGVQVAMGLLLQARSPEELRQLASKVQLEPKPDVPTEELPKLEQPEHQKSAAPQEKLEENRPQPERPRPEQQRTPGRPESNQDKLPLEARKDIASPLARQADNPKGVPGHLAPSEKTQDEQDQQDPNNGRDRRGTNKRLGANMLWNVLHRFRDSPEDSAIEREKWDQIAFAAMMALVGMGLAVALLASL
jgi:hypothetical protein